MRLTLKLFTDFLIQLQMQEFCSKRHETAVIQCEPTNGAKATLEEMSQKMSTNHAVIEFGEDYPKSKYLLNQRINQST